MENSRDLALIIVFAVLGFVFMALVAQIPVFITGIPEIHYASLIIYSILQTVSWLMYEGRRWRIFAQGLLFTLLSLSFIPSWGPPAALATIINMLIVDVIFNSVYGFFKRKNLLILWAISVQVYYWTTHSLLILLILSSLLMYPFEAVLENWYIPIFSVMLPVMIIEAIVGAYIGYKIYRRVEKLAE